MRRVRCFRNHPTTRVRRPAHARTKPIANRIPRNKQGQWQTIGVAEHKRQFSPPLVSNVVPYFLGQAALEATRTRA